MQLKERIKRELQRLVDQHGGICTPEQVVEAARDEESPLHDQFDWDDSEAGHKWRVHQARNLLRLQVEIVKGSNETVRAFVSLTTDRKISGGYRTLSDVREDEAMFQQMLDDAMAELRVFRRKYAALKALQPLFETIDEIETRKTKPIPMQAQA